MIEMQSGTGPLILIDPYYLIGPYEERESKDRREPYWKIEP
jgi:hypothetical protein